MYQLPIGYRGKQIALFDCTATYDRDVFFSGPGTHLVHSPLGDYLETSNEPLSRFGYRFPLQNADRPHMLIVAYPDDKRRHMMLGDCCSYDLSTGVLTGGEYPVTNTKQRIHHIFWPRFTDMTLNFTAWGQNEPAAAFGFAVYELEELPKEADADCTGKYRSFGVQYEDPCGAVSDLGAMTFDQWGEKFLEYARHTGQNRLVYPINWYCGPMYDSQLQPGSLQYWLTLPNRQQYTVASSCPDDWLSPFLDRCAEAGVEFVGGMTLLRLGNMLDNMNTDLPSIAAGADTYNNMRCDNGVQASTNDWTPIYNPLNYEKMISEGRAVRNTDGFTFVYGETKDSFGSAPMFNPLHPEVQRQLIAYFTEISQRFGRKKAFKGVAVNIWHATILWFSSLRLGYDDATLGLFTKETGISVPCDPRDPQRFQKRYAYLTGKIRKFWIDWRCRKIHELILRLRDALRSHNPELKLYINVWNEPSRKKIIGDFDSSSQYPAVVNMEELLREGGFDLALYRDVGICVSMEQNQHRDRGWTTQGTELPEEDSHIFHDLAYMDTSWMYQIQKMQDNGAFVFDSWEEGWGSNSVMPFNVHQPEIDAALAEFSCSNITFYEQTFRLKEDGFWFDSQRQITSCFPSDRNYLEPFAHAVAKLDPMFLLRGGLYLDKSHAALLREYTSVFTRLPAVKFCLVPGREDPVALREQTVDGSYYLYAVNLEPYPVTVKICLQKEADLRELRTDAIVSAGKTEFSFTVRPFSMEGFCAAGENGIRVHEETVPERILESLGALCARQLEIFRWLEDREIGLAGVQQIQKELEAAWHEQKPARMRHILQCYVSAKARQCRETAG